jgi:hypothetical protein
MKLVRTPFPIAVVVLAALGGCGGDNTVQPPPPTVAPAPPTTVTTTSTTTTTTQPVDPSSTRCSNLAPGPVVRYAIAPREQRSDGVQTDGMRVRARPGFDEVWCIDKDKEHRLDFNSNQRNADGKECCWVADPEWKVNDPDKVVDSAAPIPNTGSFNFRLRVDTHGARATVEVQASLDGNESFPWQSNSGYTKGPLRIVAMPLNEINRDCKCIFRGNGIYEGDGCTK